MKPQRRIPEPTGPAIVTEAHIQDRPLSTVAGAPKAWRKRSVLEVAFDKGQLNGGDPRYDEKMRLEAGQEYTKLFLTSASSGKDSTDLDRISSISTRMPLSQRQADAMHALIRIESHMGLRDGLIIRAVCGEDRKMSEAIMGICGTGYRDRITARFREALDALIEALETWRRA